MQFLFSRIGHRLTIGLRGVIDAGFKLGEEIQKTLRENMIISEVIFVLRRVEKFDKEGIDAWFKEIKKLSDAGYTLTFIECPHELLEPVFTDKDKSLVLKSFIVPYYCSVCNEEFPQLINTSSITLSFSAYSKPSCPICNKRLSLDITDDEIERITSLLPIEDTYSERRKYPRFDASIYNIKVDVTMDDKTSTFDLVNYSEAGICISGKQYFEPGEDIKVELEYKGKKVSTNGVVIWYSTGKTPDCYFLGISIESKDIFYLLIKP